MAGNPDECEKVQSRDKVSKLDKCPLSTSTRLFIHFLLKPQAQQNDQSMLPQTKTKFRLSFRKVLDKLYSKYDFF